MYIKKKLKMQMHNKFGSIFSDLSKILGEGCAVEYKPPLRPFFVQPAISYILDVHFSCLMFSGN